MKSEMALKIIAGLSAFGLLFSGYLSYSELFAKTCAIGGCSVVSGIPACVYGFVMYLLVFATSLLGLQNK